MLYVKQKQIKPQLVLKCKMRELLLKLFYLQAQRMQKQVNLWLYQLKIKKAQLLLKIISLIRNKHKLKPQALMHKQLKALLKLNQNNNLQLLQLNSKNKHNQLNNLNKLANLNNFYLHMIMTTRLLQAHQQKNTQEKITLTFLRQQEQELVVELLQMMSNILSRNLVNNNKKQAKQSSQHIINQFKPRKI